MRVITNVSTGELVSLAGCEGNVAQTVASLDRTEVTGVVALLPCSVVVWCGSVRQCNVMA